MSLLDDHEEVAVCLNTILQRLKITIENFKRFSNVGKGQNYTEEIRRFWIKGKDLNNKCVELKLIVKIAPKNISVRSYLSIEKSYQCESIMYDKVFPLFSKIQTEANIAEHFNSYPKYFISSMKYLNEVVVFEDMTHFKVVNRLNTLNYNQALVLVQEIGKFHALSFVVHKKYPKLYQDISGKIRNERRDDDGLSKTMKSCLNVWMLEILNVLDSNKEQEVYEKINGFSKNLDKYFDLHYNFNSGDKYGVINHCDLWACNLMFDDENNPSKVCILDWQTARISSPSIDLTEILLVCCDKNVRREHGNDLIEAYYNSCALHIKQLGENINEIFPLSVFKKHLNMYSGYSLCIAVRTVCMLSIAVNEFPDLSLPQNFLELAETFRGIKLNAHTFNERIRDIVFDYISYGYNL